MGGGGGGGGGGVLQAQVDGLFFFSIQTPVTLKASGSEIDSKNFTNLSVHKKNMDACLHIFSGECC